MTLNYDPTAEDEQDDVSGLRRRPRMALPGVAADGPPPIDAPPLAAGAAPGASPQPGGMKAQIAPLTPQGPALDLPGIGGKINPDFEKHRAEYERMHDTGSGVEQLRQKPGFGHKLLSTMATIGDVAGTAFFPGIAAAIPGTSLHHDVLMNRESGAANRALRQGEEQATTAKTLADAENVGSERTTPDALTLHDLMTGENGQPRINPDTQKPYTYLEAYERVKGAGQKAATPKAPILRETDEGVFLVDPETGEARPATYQGKPLSPKSKPADEHTKDISDFLAANKLEDTPENREKARDMIARRAPAARVNVAGPSGEWQLAEDDSGKTVLYNPKTGETRAAPAGVAPKGTHAKKEADYQKNIAPLESAMNFADTYLASGKYTGSDDDTLMLQYFELAKPESGFRLNTAEIARQNQARSWRDSAQAQLRHATTGTWFSDDQRKQIVDSMHHIGDAKKAARLGGPAGSQGGGGWAPPAGAPAAPKEDGHQLKQHGQVVAVSKGGQWTQP